MSLHPPPLSALELRALATECAQSTSKQVRSSQVLTLECFHCSLWVVCPDPYCCMYYSLVRLLRSENEFLYVFQFLWVMIIHKVTRPLQFSAEYSLRATPAGVNRLFFASSVCSPRCNPLRSDLLAESKLIRSPP